MPENDFCSICGKPLTSPILRRNGVCDAGQCQGQYGRRQAERALESRRAARRSIIDDVVQREPHFAEVSCRVVVPANERPLAAAAPERQAAFRSHLDMVLEQGFAAEPAAIDEYESQNVMDEEAGGALRERLGEVCAVCRGDCCVNGREHAFVDVDTVRYQRYRQSEITKDQLRRQYVDHLPSESYDGSCVFHGASGCMLPRSIRGVTCNRFFCEPLYELRIDLRREPSTEILVISVDEQESPVRRVVP